MATEYYAVIRSNISGREAVSESHEYSEATEYWWESGNMSCDCNLERYFPDEPQTEECGESRYIPIKLVMDSGEEIPLTRD